MYVGNRHDILQYSVYSAWHKSEYCFKTQLNTYSRLVASIEFLYTANLLLRVENLYTIA
jgi:hypothetical protein